MQEAGRPDTDTHPAGYTLPAAGLPEQSRTAAVNRPYLPPPAAGHAQANNLLTNKNRCKYYKQIKKLLKMKLKKTILLMTTLAAAALITSCTNDNDEATANDGAVRFTAGIGREAVATPQTRAAGTTWGAGDEIGVFMLDHGSMPFGSSAKNKQYVTDKGDGAFTPAVGHEIYYPMDNNHAVDFIAYYPYRDDATLMDLFELGIATTQTDATQAATDLMWAKADNNGSGYTKGRNTTVALTFGHCLAKLTMNCKVDASVGAPEVLDDGTVTIHGMNTGMIFAFASGTVRVMPNSFADITPRKAATVPAGFHATYDAIILPDAYADGQVTVDFTTAGGETFTWNVGAITLEPGHEYIYEVTITRTKVVANCTIKPWDTENKGPVTAE